jgi:hypothetical protein
MNPLTQLQKDVEHFTQGNTPVAIIADQLYPRAMEALELAETTDDVNKVRHQIETVGKWIARRIPTEITDRARQLKKANKWNDLFISACVKAGEAWDVAEKFSGRPPEDSDLLTAQQSGFSSNRDARNCVKASKIHEEDYRTYKEECDKNGRQYTIGGLVKVYDLLNPKDTSTNVPPLKRLQKIEELSRGLIDDVEGDVNILVRQIHRFSMDAIEIQREEKS